MALASPSALEVNQTPAAPAPAQAQRGRPPRVLSVVWDVGVSEVVDWSSWYLTDEDDMGQIPRQNEAIDAFKAVLLERVSELGLTEAFVGADAFFAWVESEPLVRVSPDVYLLPRRPDPLPASFQTWRPGHVPPQLAVEIASEDWKKDYEGAPQKYAQLGVAELVVFDPDVVDRGPKGPDRFAVQVFRRSADGLFVRSYAGFGPAWIESVRAFGVVTQTEIAPVLRLAYDAEGRRWVPTAAERARSERDEAARERDEAARERDEAARERDEERQRRLELEARLAELERKHG